MKSFGGSHRLSKHYKKPQKHFLFISSKTQISVLSMRSGLLLWRKIYNLRGGFEEYGVDLVEKRRVVVIV